MILEEKHIEDIAKSLGYKHLRRYPHKGNFLYSSIPILGKRILEIGCGRGAWALWGALNGAKYALGIEPELSGSTKDALAIFQGIIDRFSLGEVVKAAPISYQELDSNEPFDIVIMFNVINHIDEKAVIDLDKDISKQELYILELKRIRKLLTKNGLLIVADSGRSNFWNSLGFHSPFCPTVNWQIHQDPDFWVTLFQKAGFSLIDLRWSPLGTFGSLTGNRHVQWLTMSHFVLRFRAS